MTELVLPSAIYSNNNIITNVYFLKVFSKPMYGLLFSFFLLLFVPISLSISWPVDYVCIVH